LLLSRDIIVAARDAQSVQSSDTSLANGSRKSRLATHTTRTIGRDGLYTAEPSSSAGTNPMSHASRSAPSSGQAKSVAQLPCAFSGGTFATVAMLRTLASAAWGRADTRSTRRRDERRRPWHDRIMHLQALADLINARPGPVRLVAVDGPGGAG
jgi:hypothetical protein